MKKTAILLAVVMTISLFAGCFAKPLEITFVTEAYSYLTTEDTLDVSTSETTNLYISKVACAEEALLNEGGPSFQSAYSKPADSEPSTYFELGLDRMEKFDGMLCDVYVMAYDESTIEETETVVRINFGAETVVEEVVEEELCEDGTICVDDEAIEEEADSDEEIADEVVAEEEVVVEDVDVEGVVIE